MREIKFRAWDRVANEILVVKKLEFGRNQSNALWASLSDGHILHQRYIEIMQFTGLKDSKGVEIYEGDILACGEYDFVGRVEQEVGGLWVLKGPCLGEHLPVTKWLLLGFVIGNIYEHEELLNAQAGP